MLSRLAPQILHNLFAASPPARADADDLGHELDHYLIFSSHGLPDVCKLLLIFGTQDWQQPPVYYKSR